MRDPSVFYYFFPFRLSIVIQQIFFIFWFLFTLGAFCFFHTIPSSNATFSVFREFFFSENLAPAFVCNEY